MCRTRIIFAIFSVAFLPSALLDRTATGQGIAAIQQTSSRPFVTGFTPVIGRNGSVGGIEVDASGVVSMVDSDRLEIDRGEFREIPLSNEAANDLARESSRRVISLARLDRALAELIKDGQSVPQEMVYLAGLRRIDFVVSSLETNDVLIVGPAGGWRSNRAGEVLSISQGVPVMRLDDLIEAHRSANRSDRGVITCSIEPTEQGQQRYAKVRARMRSFNSKSVRALEAAIGDQQIVLGGIDPQSHFAQVLVSADIAMKRLAMGFDKSPVPDMPSYLDLLQSHPAGVRLSSPRWWMTANYPPLKCTNDRLTWQINSDDVTQSNVETMTQDSKLDPNGRRSYSDEANPLAQKWADTMTNHFDDLSCSISVLGELRNCIDLSVACALIAEEGLLVQADCELQVLGDPSRLQVPHRQTPKTIASKASLVRSKSGWIVSVSGGVRIDPWQAIENVETEGTLQPIAVSSPETQSERWWWNVKR